MDVVTYALAQKYVKNAIGSLDAVTDVTVDGNSVVNADGVAEIVTPQILGEVTDVKVDGQSVVDSEGVAQITLHDTTLANNFADEYDASTSYEVGDLCIKDLVLYRCTTATTGTWDDTKWEEITVEEVLDEADKVDDVQTYGGNTLVTNKLADLSALTMKKSIPSTPTAIATFSDGAEMVMPSLTVGVDAVQDLHGYDSPWVGGAGKNKWEPITGTYRGITFSLENGGKIKASGQVSTAGYIQLGYDIALEDSPFSVGDSITIKSSSNTQCVVRFLRSDSTYTQISSSNGVATTDTIPNDCVTLRLIEYAGTSSYSVGDNINLIMTFQVEKGTIASDWTPYSNICPISGWTEGNVSVSGVNVWDEEWEIGNIDNGTGLPVSSSSIIRTKNYINVVPNTTYFCKYLAGEGNTTVFYYDINKNFISLVYVKNMEITTPNNCKYIRFKIASSYGTTYNNDISINYPSTDTSYHAYNGQTYTIDLNGTRYGGELDVVSGVLTVDRIKWTLTPTVNQIAGVGISDCIISIPADKTPIDWNVNVNKCMCNKLKVSNYSAQHDNHVHFPNSAIIALYLADEIGTTKQEWVDYLAQAQIDVSYIIATPLTIQLTPTAVKSLEGVNNVFADSGEILEGEYIADASAVIAGLDARITALENA